MAVIALKSGTLKGKLQFCNKQTHQDVFNFKPLFVAYTVGVLYSYWFFSKKTNKQKTQEINNHWIVVMFLSAVWTLILAAPIHCHLNEVTDITIYDIYYIE